MAWLQTESGSELLVITLWVDQSKFVEYLPNTQRGGATKPKYVAERAYEGVGPTFFTCNGENIEREQRKERG